MHLFRDKKDIKNDSLSYNDSHTSASLKRYGEKYKLTVFNFPPVKAGFEREVKKATKKSTINNVKLDCNLSRARGKIFEYATCNDFDYFITLTLDSKKYNRSDLKKYIKDLGQFIQNYNKKYEVKIEYLLIPELHKDKINWHMHGLIRGILPEHLVKNEHNYLDWSQYSTKFGYCSVDRIKNKDRCAKYITKYVGKGFGLDIKELESKLYYCSKGLKKSELVTTGIVSSPLVYDFQNDFVKLKWFDSVDDLDGLQLIK